MARHQCRRHTCQELHDTSINQFPTTETTSATAQRLRNDTWYLNCAETASAWSGKSSIVALNTTGPQMQQSVDPSLMLQTNTRHRPGIDMSTLNCLDSPPSQPGNDGSQLIDTQTIPRAVVHLCRLVMKSVLAPCGNDNDHSSRNHSEPKTNE